MLPTCNNFGDDFEDAIVQCDRWVLITLEEWLVLGIKGRNV